MPAVTAAQLPAASAGAHPRAHAAEPRPSRPQIAEEDVFILGLDRSGLQSAVNWMIPHYPGLVRLINDHDFALAHGGTSPIEGHPTQYFHSDGERTLAVYSPDHFRELEERHLREARTRGLARMPALLRPIARAGIGVLRGWRASTPAPKPAYTLEPTAASVTANLFVIENLAPKDFAEAFPRWHREHYRPHLTALGLQPATRATIVLVLDEPWKALAETPDETPARHPVDLGAIPELWSSFAREFAGETRFLDPCGRIVRFGVPAWSLSPFARRYLAAQLGRTWTDRGLEARTSAGDAASAANPDLLRRSVDRRNRRLMRRLYEDPEVQRLSKMIFGATVPPVSAQEAA